MEDGCMCKACSCTCNVVLQYRNGNKSVGSQFNPQEMDMWLCTHTKSTEGFHSHFFSAARRFVICHTMSH